MKVKTTKKRNEDHPCGERGESAPRGLRERLGGQRSPDPRNELRKAGGELGQPVGTVRTMESSRVSASAPVETEAREVQRLPSAADSRVQASLLPGGRLRSPAATHPPARSTLIFL